MNIAGRARNFFGAYFHEGAAGYVGFIALGLALDLLTLPPGPLPLLIFVADAPLLWVLFFRGGQRWKRWTFLYGALHFGFALRWLAQVHPVQLIGASLVLAPVYLLLGLAIRALVKRRAPFVLSVGVCVVLEELLRTIWCGGMPWPARSLAFAGDAPLGGSLNLLLPAAGLAGAYGLSFVAGMGSAVFSAVPPWLARRGDPSRPSGLRLLRAAVLPFGCLLLLAVFSVMRRNDFDDGAAAGTTIETAQDMLLVQASIPQALKHSDDASSSNEIFDRHIEQSVAGLAWDGAGRSVFAVMWPETMIPWSFVGPDLGARFPEEWENEVVVLRRIRNDAPMGVDASWLIGVIYQFRRGDERHPELWDYGSLDSLFHIEPRFVPGKDDPTPQPGSGDRRPVWEPGRHDKVHLVPGGEYTPGGDVFPPLRWFRNFVSVIPELDAGAPDQKPFVLHSGPRWTAGPRPEGSHTLEAGSVICYDLAFPATCRDWRRRGAEVLLNPANYGWYGKTGFRDQIQAIARLRAAELSVTVVMAGNTGPTAFYDPLGATYGTFVRGARAVSAGNIDTTHQEGFARAPLVLDRGPPTPYVRWGDLPWFGLALGLLGWTLLRPLRRRQRSETGTRTAPTTDEGIG